MCLVRAAMVLAIAFPSVASAEAWYRLGASPDHASVVFADAASVTVGSHGLRSAWFDTYYDPQQRAPFGSESSQDHDEFDCAARSIRIVTSIYYKPDGSVGRIGKPDAAPFPVRPDTVGEAKLLFACEADHGGFDQFVFSPGAPTPKEASRLYFSATSGAKSEGAGGR